MASKEALGMSLEISQEYIDNLTKDLLEQSLIETLDAKNTIVQNIVSNVLSAKVNEEGRVSSYNSDNKYTFLEYLVRKMIREEALSVTEEVLKEKRKEIRDTIKKELNKKATIDKFFDAFMSSTVDNLDSRYRTFFDIRFEKIENY